jgi:hypothetical protein
VDGVAVVLAGVDGDDVLGMDVGPVGGVHGGDVLAVVAVEGVELVVVEGDVGAEQDAEALTGVVAGVQRGGHGDL